MLPSCREQSELRRLFEIGSRSRACSPLSPPLQHVCSPAHKGHEDLTSSPPSSGLSPAVSSECPAEPLATEDGGCARCGTYPNISRQELPTAMHNLCSDWPNLRTGSPRPIQDLYSAGR